MFSLRVLSTRVVFMLGPAANHRILVSHAADFTWRDGGFSDLIPLLGDGLLTIDGEFHRRSRRIMLPAFHRDRIAAALDDDGGGDRAGRRAVAARATGSTSTPGRAGWRCASRCARCSDSTPTRGATASTPRASSSARSPSTARSTGSRSCAGRARRSRRLLDARRRLDGLILGEIARRRRSGARGEDLLSLLLDAEDEDGSRLSDAHVRDEVMTLLFAGHDTTTATVAFLFHELAHRPDVAEAIAAELPPRPGYEDLMGGGLVARSTARSTRRCGSTRRPGSARAARSARSTSRASRSRPARRSTTPPTSATGCPTSSPTRTPSGPSASRTGRPGPRARTCRSAAGSRQCIGMRFGQLEIKAIAARILRRAPARARARPAAGDPPDAHARAARRDADARPRVRRWG